MIASPTKPRLSWRTPSIRILCVKPHLLRALLCLWLVSFSLPLRATDLPAVAQYKKEIEPLLSQYCYDCHADGTAKGGISLDEFKSDDALIQDRELWAQVSKNVRAGLMPPQKKPHPTTAEQTKLFDWVKYGVFDINPAHPDPGRVTVRRLNRAEYHNTIRDLMGVDFNATEAFPSDDTGYGFDNIGDVLSVSPLLLEKYMQAAEKIVGLAIPLVGKVIAETTLAAKDFKNDSGTAAERLSFYKPANVSSSFTAPFEGSYVLALTLKVHGSFDFDPGKCKFSLKVDGQDAWQKEFVWEDGKKFDIEIPQSWKSGEHRLAFQLEPLLAADKKKNTSVDMEIVSVRVQGPKEENHWVPVKNHQRFFSKAENPKNADELRNYAREVLTAFAKKAFRRPADERTLDRLAKLAENVYGQPNKSFEQGISAAMVAVLSSPRFLFRIEQTVPEHAKDPYGPVDEYTLAMRLSYFLWSTMPDDQLIALADRGELRKNLTAQVNRLLADPRSRAFIENFTGQWLQGRDVEGISVDARLVLARDKGEEKELQLELEEFRARLAAREAKGKTPALLLDKIQDKTPVKPQDKTQDKTPAVAPPAVAVAPAAPASPPIKRPRLFQPPAVDLTEPLRKAMRLEPEMVFAGIVHEDRSLSELLDCDYTYLNDKLAKHYGIPGVTGPEMRRVTLPADSPRGGLLTMGSILVVTSNPTRTSPVKRGQFVLDNILGMPTPPPPADVPALEESEKGFKDHEPTARESLALHRDAAVCRSCHARMDPLGLSLESFNAMGMWRESERGQKIDAAGQLLTGESFQNIRELKRILKQNHTPDFYRCLTEKLLIYALGRGTDDNDVEAVDRIVARLEKNDGRFSALLSGVIESSPFQERRNRSAVDVVKPKVSVR